MTATQAVYDAEQEVRRMLDDEAPVRFHGTLLHPVADRRFGDIEGVRRYVGQVSECLAAWGYPAVPAPGVRERAGSTKAHYETARQTIAVPTMREGRWACRELVVLHELAHHVAWRTSAHAGHGPVFCKVHADLVRRACEGPAGLLLTWMYDEIGALT